MMEREQRDDVRIDPARAKAMLQSGEARVLDVVASHVWPTMRYAIRGAVRVPPEEIADQVATLSRDRAVIAYCT